LEDNMIIGLDASDMLTSFGAANVRLASNVDAALAIIESEAISFAVLDVNLGNQTSVSIAQKLDALQVPFILATGYGDFQDILVDYPTAPVLQKPFTAESLSKTAAIALGR